MSRKDSLAKLERTLMRRRDALRATLRGELERFHTMEERIVGDVVDMAVDADYGNINSQLAETESRELERIEHALVRIREGGYGICEMCGRKIAKHRLRALPYATNCIRCQRSAEDHDGQRRLDVDWSRITTVDADAEDEEGGMLPVINVFLVA